MSRSVVEEGQLKAPTQLLGPLEGVPLPPPTFAISQPAIAAQFQLPGAQQPAPAGDENDVPHPYYVSKRKGDRADQARGGGGRWAAAAAASAAGGVGAGGPPSMLHRRALLRP